MLNFRSHQICRARVNQLWTAGKIVSEEMNFDELSSSRFDEIRFNDIWRKKNYQDIAISYK